MGLTKKNTDKLLEEWLDNSPSLTAWLLKAHRAKERAFHRDSAGELLYKVHVDFEAQDKPLAGA